MVDLKDYGDFHVVSSGILIPPSIFSESWGDLQECFWELKTFI